MSDWIGNYKSVSVINGLKGHGNSDREINDYYATDPSAIDRLLSGGVQLKSDIWEPACGEGHLSERLKRFGYNVYSTDLIDRGYGDDHFDFLTSDMKWHGDIVTNPPYKYAVEFVEHALDLIDPYNAVVLLLKLTFLEGQKREALFDRHELETVCVFRKRVPCAKNGDFDGLREAGGSAVAYGWFVFRKGYNDYPRIMWI